MIGLITSFKDSLINRLFIMLVSFLEIILQPLLLLAIRLWMARIFWHSAMTKISDWQSTIFLFKEEYKVPIISPEHAAYLATATEIAAPILLTIGFMSRLASLSMLAMTIVIQLTYLDFQEHFYWMFLLLTIICFGSGKISLDYIVIKQIK